MVAPRLGDNSTNETAVAALPDGAVPKHGVHPDWSPGFWEELERLGPASEEFEDAVRAWVPSPTWRDRVIEAWVDEMNSPEAAATPPPPLDAHPGDGEPPAPDRTSE